MKTYTLEDLEKAIESLKLHDKDEFMLLNMIKQIKENLGSTD